MKLRSFLPLFFLGTCALLACRREQAASTPTALFSYGDTIFPLKSSAYTVAPKTPSGTYTAFPDNLTIDHTTGVVTVGLKGTDGESQTGMRYKIRYTSAGGTNDSTYITIAGITYIDRFYRLTQNESTISPVYNGLLGKPAPDGGYTISADNKLAINSNTGQIDINETVRRGFFDNSLNASWKQTTIRYRGNDGSTAVNSLDIILYYYNSINEVPSNVSALMQAHLRLMPGLDAPPVPSTAGAIDNRLSSDLSFSKPRPPCIVIIAH